MFLSSNIPRDERKINLAHQRLPKDKLILSGQALKALHFNFIFKLLHGRAVSDLAEFSNHQLYTYFKTHYWCYLETCTATKNAQWQHR